jgi:hypothetical protein
MRPEKQATRMLKCACATCGYIVRTTRKWLETAGAPLCPIEGMDQGDMSRWTMGSAVVIVMRKMMAKRLSLFTTKRLSDISRLAA